MRLRRDEHADLYELYEAWSRGVITYQDMTVYQREQVQLIAIREYNRQHKTKRNLDDKD